MEAKRCACWRLAYVDDAALLHALCAGPNGGGDLDTMQALLPLLFDVRPGRSAQVQCAAVTVTVTDIVVRVARAILRRDGCALKAVRRGSRHCAHLEEGAHVAWGQVGAPRARSLSEPCPSRAHPAWRAPRTMTVPRRCFRPLWAAAVRYTLLCCHIATAAAAAHDRVVLSDRDHDI